MLVAVAFALEAAAWVLVRRRWARRLALACALTSVSLIAITAVGLAS